MSAPPAVQTRAGAAKRRKRCKGLGVSDDAFPARTGPVPPCVMLPYFNMPYAEVDGRYWWRAMDKLVQAGQSEMLDRHGLFAGPSEARC